MNEEVGQILQTIQSMTRHSCQTSNSSGGLAGGISNALLYPIDTIKTMQQSDKSIKGFKSAITKLQNGNGGLIKLYSGFWAAVVGSIPSSAIYFGSYETSKRLLYQNCEDRISRPFIHMLAAASGNIMSSFVFVPKDAIKQQMQAIKTGSIPWVRMSPFYSSSIKSSVSTIRLPDVIKSIMKKKGIKGFYPNYRATLMRNIPSAVVRLLFYIKNCIELLYNVHTIQSIYIYILYYIFIILYYCIVIFLYSSALN